MAILQLLIITNHSRRIIGFLHVNCIFIKYFDTRPDQTRPTQDAEFCDPTRSTDGPDHVQLWASVAYIFTAYPLSLSSKIIVCLFWLARQLHVSCHIFHIYLQVFDRKKRAALRDVLLFAHLFTRTTGVPNAYSPVKNFTSFPWDLASGGGLIVAPVNGGHLFFYISVYRFHSYEFHHPSPFIADLNLFNSLVLSTTPIGLHFRPASDFLCYVHWF